MKTTGIVRRIDDLGRVVIPREIRNSLGIRDNDPMEIFVDGDSVIFRKYYVDAINHYVDYIKQALASFCIEAGVCDRDYYDIEKQYRLETRYTEDGRLFPINDGNCSVTDEPIAYVYVKSAVPNVDQSNLIKGVIRMVEKMIVL